MQCVEIPEFPKLRGEKAIEALCEFVSELEEQKGKELTEKQTKALMKFAWGLISSIEAEMHARACARPWLEAFEKEIEKFSFMSKLKRTVDKYIPESFSRTMGLG